MRTEKSGHNQLQIHVSAPHLYPVCIQFRMARNGGKRIGVGDETLAVIEFFLVLVGFGFFGS